MDTMMMMPTINKACLLMLLCIHIGKDIHAGGTNYSSSFAPTETHKFWSSSPSANYTFGFKKVGSTPDYILAIWHSKDPDQTAIWWAEFGDNPIVKGIASFNKSSSGMLEIHSSPSATVWSAGNSTANSIEFLDSGNLRLLNNNNSGSNDVVWESSGDLRDTLMLVNITTGIITSKPNLLRSRSNQSSYATGKYSMAIDDKFNFELFGIDQLGNQYAYMKDSGVSINISYAAGEVSVGSQDSSAYISTLPWLDKLTLDIDGELRVYRWSSINNTWVKQWELPSLDYAMQCRIGNPCGPFGICSVNGGSINCSCPTGFHANSSNDRSLGCSRDYPLPACGTQSEKYNLTMTEDLNKDYYYNDFYYFKTVNDIEDCRQSCLSNCTCLAATYTVSGSCYLKGNSATNYLVNGISISSSPTLMMKVAVPVVNVDNKSDKKPVLAVVVACVAAVAVIIILIGVWVLRRRRCRYGYGITRGWKSDDGRSDVVTGTGPIKFSYLEIVQATEDFAHPLDDDGNGMVYKGWLKGNNRVIGKENTVVSVKLLKLSMAGKQDKMMKLNQVEEQFQADVRKLGKMHHINLVTLIGYCIAQRGRDIKLLLVYEYMENSSLEKYLSPHNTEEQLPWTTRYAIAAGIARGLAYLHHDCNPPVLHCDICPQNVLLNGKFVPKLYQFGCSKQFQPQKDRLNITGVLGTRGYIAPEWLNTDEITTKVDVYSFGMVLLELIHGHFTTGYDYHKKLIKWASESMKTQTILPSIQVSLSNDLQLDPTNDKATDSEQKLSWLKLAIWCLHPSPAHRPAMSHVLQVIEGDHSQIADMEDPPNPAVDATTMLWVSNTSQDGVISYTPSYSVMSAR